MSDEEQELQEINNSITLLAKANDNRLDALINRGLQFPPAVLVNARLDALIDHLFADPISRARFNLSHQQKLSALCSNMEDQLEKAEIRSKLIVAGPSVPDDVLHPDGQHQ